MPEPLDYSNVRGIPEIEQAIRHLVTDDEDLNEYVELSVQIGDEKVMTIPVPVWLASRIIQFGDLHREKQNNA
ncbi:MAG TPA: hypothetical protein VLV83_08185 [Acidobacteriota bacterium]|nr:hypothetical protein [Acidobacteriota bacterium]